jgi:cation diffusion facilitator family transporter
MGHDHPDRREGGGHGHVHGIVDPDLVTDELGLRAVKWSFVVLALTSVIQVAVVMVSGSVALLADTIHNIGDAATAIPLWIAFTLARRKPTATFNYGLGRVEDLAGMMVVLLILTSAVVAGYEAVDRLLHPRALRELGWLAIAGVVGFLGNEAVAIYRIRAGRRIHSAALIADGYHARTDGLTSLAVVAGAAGARLGFPLADPIVGLAITVTILFIVWQSARAVFTRMLDGVEPGVVDEIRHAASHVPGVVVLHEVKARWIGHRLHADLTVAMDGSLAVSEATTIAASLERELRDHLPALATTSVRFGGQVASPPLARYDPAPRS